MVELLGRSRLPLSIRTDVESRPTHEEVEAARAVVAHVMTDADVRGRLPSLKIEPLVRATAILLAAGRGERAAGGKVAPGVLEFLDLLAANFGAVPSVLNNRGVARMAAGDAHRAQADFDAARRLAPAFIAPRVNELELFRRQGDTARLESACEEILRIDPKNAGALRAQLDARTSTRRPNPAVLEAAARLHAAGGATAGDLLLLGSLSLKEGDASAAARYFEEFVALDPRSVEGNRHLAGAYLTAADYASAARVYERLTEVDGPSPDYLLALGLIYDQLDRVGDAVQAYELALEHADDAEREVVREALDEFKERRGIGDVPMEGPPPVRMPEGPLPDEEEMPGLPAAAEGGEHAAGLREGDLDLSSDAFEPKVIGDFEMAGMVQEEVPVEGFTTVGPREGRGAAGPPAEEPAAGPPVAESPADATPPAEAAPVEPAPAELAPPEQPPRPASTEVEPLEGLAIEEPPAPEEPGGPVAADDSEELARALEAASAGWADTDEALERPQEDPQGRGAGVHGEPPTPPAPPVKIVPVVSAPPRPREDAPEPDDEPSDDLARELDALTGALAEGEDAAAAGEAFRRPAFDVDEFMADLEAKAAPTFDHLYDGMLEARRREAAAGAPREEPPTTPYVSAPPIEGLPGMAVGAAAGPAEAPAADDRALAPAHSFAPYAEGAVPPPIPLLLREQAEREATRPRAAPPAPEPAREAPRPTAPPMDGQLPRARERAAAGDDEVALRLVDEYLASYPDDAAAWNLRGDLRERGAAEEDALACYRNAVKYDPQLKEAWNNLGVLLHLLGRFADAAEALEAGTRVDPQDRHLWHNLGSTYHELGRLPDAIRAFDRAVQVDPHDKVSHNNRGTTLYELGDFEGARASFQRAIEIDPEFDQAQNNLGRALEKLGAKDEAVAAYERALALNPRSRAAAANLTRLTRSGKGAAPPAGPPA